MRGDSEAGTDFGDQAAPRFVKIRWELDTLVKTRPLLSDLSTHSPHVETSGEREVNRFADYLGFMTR